MKINNTQETRDKILKAIRKDGVKLFEFTEEYQKRIIMSYTAKLMAEGKI